MNIVAHVGTLHPENNVLGDIGGVIGDTLGGVVSDHILCRSGDRVAARRNVIVVGKLGGFLFLMPVMLVHDVNVAAISLAAAFFSVELVVTPLWRCRWTSRRNMPDPPAA